MIIIRDKTDLKGHKLSSEEGVDSVCIKSCHGREKAIISLS
jgi:hypothetical protein